MSWKDKFRQARGKAGSLGEAAMEQAAQLLDQHWALVRTLWREKLDPSLRGVVMDDEKLKSCLRVVHDALPLPIRLAVSEETFIRVCMKNRDRWLPAEERTPPQQEPEQKHLTTDRERDET